MFKLFEFLFCTLPLILAWLYMLVAALIVIAHILLVFNKEKVRVSEWIFIILNTGYVLLFLITRIFFAALWEQLFTGLGLCAIIISGAWSAYEDKRNGRKWWEW